MVNEHLLGVAGGDLLQRLEAEHDALASAQPGVTPLLVDVQERLVALEISTGARSAP